MEFTELIRPLSAEQFVRGYWGVQPFCTALRAASLRKLRRGFHQGEVGPILAECRRDDNSPYSAEELSALERDLDASRKTLNMPYCFCEGALQLSSAFIACCGHLANDVEVGVYFSDVGGDVASWHQDNNHNITIQLYGQKEWHHQPGTLAADSSSGMFDAPRNRCEQLHRMSQPTAQSSCFNLAAGSVLYVPPGWWHSVVPLEGGSVSVDIRAGSLTHARWVSEALYVSLMTGRGPRAVQPLFVNEEASASLQALVNELSVSLPAILDQCKVPRCLPFEFSLSDGLNRGGSLDFLFPIAESVVGRLAPETELGVSPLVAINLKLRAADLPGGSLVIEMLGTSSLTGMEYLRYRIYTSLALHAQMAALVENASECFGKLRAACKKPKRLHQLLRVLVYARVLYCVTPARKPLVRQPTASKRRHKAGDAGNSTKVTKKGAVGDDQDG